MVLAEFELIIRFGVKHLLKATCEADERSATYDYLRFGFYGAIITM